MSVDLQRYPQSCPRTSSSPYSLQSLPSFPLDPPFVLSWITVQVIGSIYTELPGVPHRTCQGVGERKTRILRKRQGRLMERRNDRPIKTKTEGGSKLKNFRGIILCIKINQRWRGITFFVSLQDIKGGYFSFSFVKFSISRQIYLKKDTQTLGVNLFIFPRNEGPITFFIIIVLPLLPSYPLLTSSGLPPTFSS